MTRGVRSSALLALLLLSACGGDDSKDSPVTPDASGGGGDAGVQQCALFLVLPQTAEVGIAVEVEASLSFAPTGARSFQWSVERAGVPQTISELSDPPDRISFIPQEAGPFQVVVQGAVDGSACVSDVGTVNVSPPGAVGQDYRLRIIPRGETPTVDYPIVVLGGADAVLPTISVEAGLVASGVLTTNEGGNVPAYIRARRVGTQSPIDYETFSTINGDFSIRLPVGVFDLTIVPSDPSLPSAKIPAQSNSAIASTLSLPALQTYAGHVFDAAGNPLSGARVSLVADDATSTASISQADGSFAVQSFGTLLTGVRVASPTGSGLPALVSDLSQGQVLTPTSDVVIRFSDPVVSVSVDLSVASGPIPSQAQAQWRASFPVAGTVFVDSQASLSGELSVTAMADALGHVEASVVARTSDFSATATTGESLVRTNVPWASTPSQAIVLEPWVDVAIVVKETDSSSEQGNSFPAPGVRIQASPSAVLSLVGTTHRRTSLADGSLSLPLVQGAWYQLEVVKPQGASMLASIPKVEVGAEVLELTLPSALMISGRLAITGASSAGAQISVYCVDCTEEDRTRPLSSAVSDESGHFQLHIADPGIVAQ